MPGRSKARLRDGVSPAAPWEWTDDTEMACSVVAELRDRAGIDRDRLAAVFADRCEPYRGYGPGAVVLLHEIRDGRPWRDAAGALFDGQGSCGNGAAMRVAPLGAYFADDPAEAARQAQRSAEVTHAHPEGIIGAVAIALAACLAAAGRLGGTRPEPAALLEQVLHGLARAEPHLPVNVGDGRTHRGIRRAGQLLGASLAEAAYELGNGSAVTAQDTVPFTLWAAATHLHDYPSAIMACVEAGGDVDTTAAIVGGIVAAHTGTGDHTDTTGIPQPWLAAREPLPDWAIRA